MAGEWIEAKARGLMGDSFPGQWDEVQPGIFQGRCPGEHLHHGGNAATDCRVHVSYGAGGQPPGCYCLHASCKGVLDDLNEKFRSGIFARDENWRPASPANAGVVMRAPVAREAWIPEFNIAKLRGLVQSVPPISPEWFIERSPVDPRKVTPGEFIEHCFGEGERVLVFTVYKGPGDFLWEVGKGGFRLAKDRNVKAVKSNLPVDGGKDGVWYLCNPVDGQWYPNPRRGGDYSRRSQESVTAWKHMVVESDEEKTRKRMAYALKDAMEIQALAAAQGDWQARGMALLAAGSGEKFARQTMATVQTPEDMIHPLLVKAGRKPWADEMIKAPERWPLLPEQYMAESRELPGLWNRFLAMAALPIKAIYSSGGDSWHALIEVNQASKADFDSYLRNSAKKFLPLIGADPAAMTPVRLTRMPGCTRGGREQRLIYLNPSAWVTGEDIKPILALPKRRTL